MRYVSTMFLWFISYRMPVILQKEKLSLMSKLLSNELGYFTVNLEDKQFIDYVDALCINS